LLHAEVVLSYSVNPEKTTILHIGMPVLSLAGFCLSEFFEGAKLQQKSGKTADCCDKNGKNLKFIADCKKKMKKNT